MSWASQRRLIILFIIGATATAFFIILSLTVFYKTPSCTDGVQNQGETGIDCGGPCAYLCVEQQRLPTVLFTKAIANNDGRTDIIASVENENATAAAKEVPYTITLYGTGKSAIQKVTGTLDLPPAATVPVYVPGVSSGSQKAIRAFLEIGPTSPKWFAMTSDTRVRPIVSNTTRGGTLSAPRIDATLTNASVTDIVNTRVIVFVHNVQGDVFAASQTIVPLIPAQGKANATFTWNDAFTDEPAMIEVIPITPLP